mmetsp:Transcript_6942/g.18761  ORF Transcript_6942/g.18761 Transcript_6942/m.18761 type:complete len:355 (+) Transcript_6942:530-1594(+)
MCKKTVLSKHSCAPDHDHCDTALAAHRSDAAAPLLDVVLAHLGDDAGARQVRHHGVPDRDGHASKPGRHDRRGVHHGRPKHGQLGGLLERQHRQKPGLLHDPWVCRKNAINVLPDLHLLRADRSADDRGGEVGPVAAKCRYGTVAVFGDVARHHWHVGIFQLQRGHVLRDRLVRLRQDLHLREGRVGTSSSAARQHAHLPAVQRPGRDAPVRARLVALEEDVVPGGEGAHAQPLAERHHPVAGATGHLPQQGYAGDDPLELLQQALDLRRHRDVELLQDALCEAADLRDVHLAGTLRALGRRDELVRGLAHGTEHDDGPLAHPRVDDARDAAQVRGPCQRGAAKLHHDHGIAVQ